MQVQYTNYSNNKNATTAGNNLVSFCSRIPAFSPETLKNFANKMSRDTLILHLNKIASPEMEGRGVGQKGIELAKEYIGQEFEKIGLEPFGELGLKNYFQKFRMHAYRVHSSFNDGVFKGKLEKSIKVPVVETSNVLGMIRGQKNPDEYLILTAHYDHLGKDNISNIAYPGADDNASSLSALLEIARVMQQDKTNKKSVIFAALSGEERLAVGATKLATSIKNAGLTNKVEVLNVEMLGGCGGNTIDIWKEKYALSKDMVKSLQDTSEAMGVKTRFHVMDDPSSDARRFSQKNIPSVCIAWDFKPDKYHNFFHTSKDTAENINVEVFERAAKLFGAFSYALANKEPVNQAVITNLSGYKKFIQDIKIFFSSRAI